MRILSIRRSKTRVCWACASQSHACAATLHTLKILAYVNIFGSNIKNCNIFPAPKSFPQIVLDGVQRNFMLEHLKRPLRTFELIYVKTESRFVCDLFVTFNNSKKYCAMWKHKYTKQLLDNINTVLWNPVHSSINWCKVRQFLYAIYAVHGNREK